jgi:hypothetical protein
VLDVMPGKGGRSDWVALMIDVHPDDLKRCFCKTAFLYVHPNEYRPEAGRSAREASLPGERQADAFQADETGDDEEAVDVNEVRDGWHGDVDQNAGPSVSAATSPIPEVAPVATTVLPFMTALVFTDGLKGDLFAL